MSSANPAVDPVPKPIGDPLDRVDGRAKVTGAARYAVEFPVPKPAYARLVPSTIAVGRIAAIDTAAAERAPGVLAVITHRNAPKLAPPPPPGASGGAAGADPFGKPYLLQDDHVTHFGQPIAMIVAETFEQARDAAPLVVVRYEKRPAALVMDRALDRAYVPEKMLNPELKPETRRGDFDAGWRAGAAQVDVTYEVPNLHNNPMEPHATIAHWEGDRLTVYDATQNVNGTQRNVATLFGLKPTQVRVVAHYIGGGFGCKGPTWEHTIATVMAAKATGRPVKLALPRQQMFQAIGYRPQSRQRMRLAAGQDGKLTAVGHEIFTATNQKREYVEAAGAATPMLYATPNLHVVHHAVPLDWPRGTIMRAPGECAGVFPLECAMDELAYALKMDPIELRRANEPPQDPDKNIPWSSRSLMPCFERGAAQFGWSKRSPEPRTMRDGRYLLGLGVATATYPANRRPTSARVRLSPDGAVLVQLAATDIGTGTYTALTQIAADALGVAPARVKVEIGDTNFPQTPGSGGSWGVASYGSAVHEACLDARRRLTTLTRDEFATGEATDAFIRRHEVRETVVGNADSKPGDEKKQHSMHAFGAHFAEVRVDPDTGEVRVSRYAGAFACGRIINEKTAKSQFAGGIVMGIGMALMEETVVDPRFGHFVNADLATYHVPVNRDIPPIDILLVEERDEFVNPLGTKGLGEIGIVGAAAAVANAVFHATGKRVRHLPITPDKVLA